MATTLTTDQLKTLMRRVVTEAWNEGNFDIIADTAHPDYTVHWLDTGADEGLDELESFLDEVRSGFPDFEMQIEFMLAEDDMIATGFTTSGTHEGEFMGVPPTGNEVVSHGIWAERFEGERTAELWTAWDALGVMRQLGVFPEAAADD